MGITRRRWTKLSMLTWRSSYLYAKLSGRLHSEHTVTTDVIRHESAKNPLIRKTMNQVPRQWPAPSIVGELLDLNNGRNSLIAIDSSLMFRKSVVIPPFLRGRVLKHFYSNHTWTKRTKLIARAYAYWPGIGKDIEILTKYFLERENKLKVYSFPFLMMWLTFIVVTCFLKCSEWRGGNHFVYIVSAYSYFIGVFMEKGTRINLLG